MSEQSPSERFWLLACLDCSPPLPMPFDSQRERGKWAAEHTKGTGHRVWRVWDEPRRSPQPEVQP